MERDDVNHKAVLHGEGRDTTGKGNADAMITATLESIDANQTKCVVSTDLRVTGKVAQFGRGIMADVSKKLMAQFADNLNKMLDESGSTPVTAAAAASADSPNGDSPTADSPTADSPNGDVSQTGDTAGTAAPEAATVSAAAAAGASTASDAGSAGPTVRKIDGPANEPIELSGLAGAAVVKRVLPGVIGLVLLLLVFRRFRK
jgi:hypothetical protein